MEGMGFVVVGGVVGGSRARSAVCQGRVVAQRVMRVRMCAEETEEKPVGASVLEEVVVEEVPGTPPSLFDADVLGADILSPASSSLMSQGKPVNLGELESVDAADLEMSRSQIFDVKMKETREKLRLHENDTGSPEFQIAQLTVKIQQLTDHLNEHPKDHSSKRGLQRMVEQRKKLFRFLFKEDVARCEAIISTLGIRFNLQRLALKNRYGSN